MFYCIIEFDQRRFGPTLNETARPFSQMEHKNTPWVSAGADSCQVLDVCGQ